MDDPFRPLAHNDASRARRCRANGRSSGIRWPVSTRRAKVRSAVIAVLVLLNALAALPTPGEPSPERLQRPFEREELARWVGLFRGLGFDTDTERLGQGYLTFSRWVVEARAVVLAPIEGWMALTQTHQGWRLFGTPDRSVSALRVSVQVAGRDEVLYESGSSDRRWNAAFLEYRRIRAEYNPSRRGPPPTYAAFGKRLSDEIFASMPNVSRVSIALVETRVALPLSAQSAADAAEGERLDHVLEFARPGA